MRAMKRTALRFVSPWIPAAALALAACRFEASASRETTDAQGRTVVESRHTEGGIPDRGVGLAQKSVEPDAKRLHDDVAWLADDAQQGRRAGTEAGKKAGDWIANRCKQLGLKPMGDHGEFEQKFEVPKPVEVGPSSSLKWNGPKAGSATLGDGVQPMFCSSGGEAHGNLDWRGYSLINGDKNWNDYASRCDGEVVLIVRGTPPSAPTTKPAEPAAAANPHGGNVEQGDGWGNSASLFLKVMNAKKNGAAAVLIAPHPSQADEPLPAFDFSRVAASGIPAVFVSAEIADQIYVGWREAVQQTDEREKSGEWPSSSAVKSSTSPLGTSVEPDIAVSADIKREKGPAYNVLGLLQGTNHDRVVVVGAHYDHLGLGGEGSLAPNAYGQVHNGADDNASGTATVLEIARVMSKGPKPACDVLFALWSGEELGLLGSEYWAQNPTIPLDRVVANLNLDMVGRAGNGSLEVLGVGSADPFMNWLKGAAPATGLTLKLNSSGQGIGGSDHQTFLKRKIPALFFFSGVHADYHKPSDDTERFESDGAAKVAALGVEIVRSMCAAGDLEFVEPPPPTDAAANQPKVGSPFRVWFGTVPEYSYEGKGLLLAGTSAGSPAEKAGMLKDDVVLQVGDVVIDNINDFMYALQTYKPGDVVLTRYLRDGKEETVRITLATRDAQ
jgi:hypothetical protein